MTYREKLENYRKKLLSEKEMEEVKEEIEKVDAINEYLADCLEEELDFTEHLPVEKALDRETKDASVSFEKYVKKSIRRVYVKLSLATGAVVLAILLFIQFGLSPLMDSMYYDPTEQLVDMEDDRSRATVFSKMNMDYMIYSELIMPGRNNAVVQAFPQGYGNYAITFQPVPGDGIRQESSVSGQLRRGKLEMYTPDYFSSVPANYFACYGMDYKSEKDYETQLKEMSEEVHVDEDGNEYWKKYWYYESPEESLEAIKGLEDDRKYMAYVSFNKDLNFQETTELMDKINFESVRNVWLAFRNCEDNNMPFGVSGHNHEVSLLEYPKIYLEKYPYLTLFTGFDEHSYEEYVAMRRDEELMTKHVLSMCRYMENADDFVKMVNANGYLNNGQFGVYENYITEHGLNYYGMVCTATKADMLKMLKKDEIMGIVPRDWE